MRKLFCLMAIAGVMIIQLFLSAQAEAAKPQRTVGGETIYIGNGFPSGPHFNLNILGKWSNGSRQFQCPEQAVYEIETPDKNVIYVPRDPHRDIGILVESGKQGPKNAIDPQAFEVTDWCSKDFDQTDAALNLPNDPLGYLVYARITGKPIDYAGTGFTADTGGCLKYAEDQGGNDLMLLGLVTTGGSSYVPTCDDSNTPGQTITLSRTGSSGGKGVNKATPITDIFEWSGTVCDIVEYFEGAATFCCVDAVDPGDGIYEHCDALSSFGDTVTECPLEYTGDINGTSGTWPYTTVYASCTTYENTWVFNIAEFVGYMWEIDSSGAYNIQVRFYPCSEQPPGTCGQ